MPQRPKLSLRTLRSLGKLVAPFFRGSKKSSAYGFLALLLGLLVLVNIINVVQSYVSRDFINALSARDAGEFYRLSLLYAGMLVAATLVAVFYRYAEERLGLVWREWMTSTMLHRYMSARNYYRLCGIPDLDNPDQRIAEDVKNFTAISLSLFLIVLNSCITLVAFIGVLASISTQLVWALVAYTIFGTIATMRVGRKLIRIHNRQYSREANLRYGLVRIRDNAESIAFFRGERKERLDVGRRFREILRNSRFMISWNRNLGFLTTGYNNLSLILPILVIAPLFLRGEVQFGVVTQSMGAFAQVLAASSVIISQFERISAYMAGVTRIDALWKELHAIPDNDEPDIKIEEGSRLKVSKLTVQPPGSSEILVRELSFHLKPGKGILIMGPSGSGKSSILRTIAGLWNAGQGSIERPNHREMIFLPQKPYMPPGSLRAQLLYPLRDRGDVDIKLAKVLEQVNLGNILERVKGNLEAKLDWSNVLSLGEQQRISFARLFISEPTIAFLDEATSALDEDNEMMLYTKMREAQFTYVSIGHRSNLIKFHDLIIRLDNKGGWEIVDAKALLESMNNAS